MPRDGSGVFSKVAGTTAAPNTTIESAKYNAAIDDIVADLNAARPLTAGGTGATSAAQALVNIGADGKMTLTSKSAGYTAVAADNNSVIRCTAALTLSLTAAATLGSGWHCWVIADGGDVVIDPNAAETVDGSATLTLPNGYTCLLICDGSGFRTDKMAATIASAISSGSAPASIQTISASVAANALTVGWTPAGKVTFRNSTLTNGTPVSVTVGSALSLTVPSGATLGTTNGQQAVLAIVLLYNAGTPVLGIINTAGGVVLDEAGLVSSTAISGASSSASTIYSASAVTNSPYRVVGAITITEATAGTWATAATVLQGDGPKALARALPVNSMVRLNTSNGWGSTNTCIRRFTNIVVNQGSDITYADSASLGASFTINANGIYAIVYGDAFSTTSTRGISINSSALSTSMSSIPISQVLACGQINAQYSFPCTWVGFLNAGDVIRPHGDGSANGSGTNQQHFSISRVS